MARMEMLKQRFTDAKHKFSPVEQIARYPLPAVGAAFALGVIAGLTRSRRSLSGESHSSLTGAAVTGLAALALRVVREAALTQLAHAAHSWWAAQNGEPTEVHGSRMPDVEPGFEH